VPYLVFPLDNCHLYSLPLHESRCSFRRITDSCRDTKADHERQTQTERTDHVVWPAGSSSPKTFSTSSPRLSPSAPSSSPILFHYHGKSRQSIQPNARDALTSHCFGKRPLRQLCSVGL